MTRRQDQFYFNDIFNDPVVTLSRKSVAGRVHLDIVVFPALSTADLDEVSEKIEKKINVSSDLNAFIFWPSLFLFKSLLSIAPTTVSESRKTRPVT